MISLYLYTPLNNNSNFIPHLIEHCVFGKTNLKNFFKFEKIDANCSTYYTYYNIDTDDMNLVNNFIKTITSTINKSVIDYEYKLLEQEYNNPSYTQRLTQEIGKKLYGNDFSYISINKLNYDEIFKYHHNWYKKENINIIKNDKKKYINKDIDIEFNIYKKYNIEIEGEIENIFIFKNDLNIYYSISIIASLLDYYIKYKLRFNESIYEYGKYYTVIGDYEDYFYISIHSKIINLLNELNDDFINEFIENSINNEEYLNDSNLDGSFIVKYGHTLSNNSKLLILNNINKYFKKIKSQI